MKPTSFTTIDSQTLKEVKKIDPFFDDIFQMPSKVEHENPRQNVLLGFEVISNRKDGFPEKIKFTNRQYTYMVNGDSELNHAKSYKVNIEIDDVNVITIDDFLEDDTVKKRNLFLTNLLNNFILSIVNTYKLFNLRFIGFNGKKVSVNRLNMIITSLKILRYILNLYDLGFEKETKIYFSFCLNPYEAYLGTDDSHFKFYKHNCVFIVKGKDKNYTITYDYEY